MSTLGKKLAPVTPEPGRPLYLSVRDSLRSAIDNGLFSPGEQMPSTKELSEQMSVSLVTAHRALQELVAAGVLKRSQGKGTFIHERYPQRRDRLSQCRVGLVIHREASLADYYHSQILEGVRRESDRLNVDLIMLRFGEDVRNECDGFLYLNPLPSELQSIPNLSRRLKAIVVGARSESRAVASVDVDNVELARQAVQHLRKQGHNRLMYVGGADELSNSRDRRRGFELACSASGMPQAVTFFDVASWRLNEDERARLTEQLAGGGRPTAIFAAGYYMALDVYAAAAAARLSIPGDLSVVGVDDPPSAAHLSPPLTTLRQPLVQLGQTAVTALSGMIADPDQTAVTRTLFAELVIRGSTRNLTAPANGHGR